MKAGRRNADGTCVRLLTDEIEFRNSFARFGTDPVNGLTVPKLARIGQQAKVVQTFDDETVTCKFVDGEELDFPMESWLVMFTQVPFAQIPLSPAV